MAATTTLEGARVLIVEDEFFIADDLARALRQKGGEPVGPASTIQQAEDLITREHLDAAILDLNLRGEMASRLIARLAEARLPCLIVSGYSEDAMPESISGVARLEKPISPSSVMETLAAQLRRAGQAAAGRAPVRQHLRTMKTMLDESRFKLSQQVLGHVDRVSVTLEESEQLALTNHMPLAERDVIVRHFKIGRAVGHGAGIARGGHEVAR